MQRFSLAACAAAICCLAVSARAQTTSADVGDKPILSASEVTWLKPRRAPLRRYYPQRAQALNVVGKASVLCTVAENGDLSCHGETEEPTGYDFAVSAADLISTRRVGPTTKSGEPTAGRVLRYVLNFNLRY